MPATPAAAASNDFILDLPHLRFPSYPLEGGFVFRVTHSFDDLSSPYAPHEPEGDRLTPKRQGHLHYYSPNTSPQNAGDLKSSYVMLELESKRLKTKWECKIFFPEDYSPQGVELPLGLVLSNLKAALEAQGQEATYYESVMEFIAQSKEWLKEDNGSDEYEATVVDLTGQDGDGSLTLRFCTKLFGNWPLPFTFPLVPVAVDNLDVLDLKLKDIQAELVRLEDETADTKQAILVVAMALFLWLSIKYLGIF